MTIPGSQRSFFWKVLLFAALSLSLFLIASLTVNSAVLASSSNESTAPNDPPAYGCPPPGTAGVAICYPVSYAPEIANPFQVVAAGTGANGPTILMELWVDGEKITEVSGSTFDQPVTLPAGDHELTMVELETTGNFISSSQHVVSRSESNPNPCVAPATAGVNVCDPMPNSCHTAPWTTILASGTAASGTVARMELWLGNAKLANFPGNTINTNLVLQDFTTIVIIEVDSNGGFVKSAPITVESC